MIVEHNETIRHRCHIEPRSAGWELMSQCAVAVTDLDILPGKRQPSVIAA
jgi:hypothetical protein